MSVRLKLVVIVVFVAFVPLAVSAFTALRIHRRAHTGALAELQRDAARHAVTVSETWLDHTIHSLAAVSSQIPWHRLDDAERTGALSLVYRQLDQVAVVQLIDDTGQGVGESVFVEAGEAREPAHPPLSLDALAAFAQHLPTRPPGAGAPPDVAVSDVFADAATGTPLVAVSIPVRTPDTTWSLGVGVSLSGLCDRLSARGAGKLRVSLWDDARRQICPVAAGRALAPAPASLSAALGRDGDRFRYRADGGDEMIASAAQTANGWTAVASQLAAAADAPSRQMWRQTVFWLALSVTIALGAGVYLARGITRSVRALDDGARALTRGELGHRIRVDGRDELSALAGAFNQMSDELQRRDEEIRAWNRELQARVDARTRELKDAQKQLLQSRKISAMSTLAAGLAHEINNPLTAVMGMAEVLRRRSETTGADDATLRRIASIEDGARRIRDIVDTLQTLSRRNEPAGFGAVDVDDVVRDATGALAERAAAAGVTLEQSLSARGLPVHGDPAQLRQVVTSLVDNALTATAASGRVEVTTGDVEGELVKLIVRDTGAGIAADNLDRVFEPFFTTKKNWNALGLGLTVCYQIVQAHNGVIKVESEPDQGTTVTVTLPIARAGAHLE